MASSKPGANDHASRRFWEALAGYALVLLFVPFSFRVSTLLETVVHVRDGEAEAVDRELAQKLPVALSQSCGSGQLRVRFPMVRIQIFAASPFGLENLHRHRYLQAGTALPYRIGSRPARRMNAFKDEVPDHDS